MSQSDEKQEPGCKGTIIGVSKAKQPARKDEKPDEENPDEEPAESESADLGPSDSDELQPDQSLLDDPNGLQGGQFDPQPEEKLLEREELPPPESPAPKQEEHLLPKNSEDSGSKQEKPHQEKDEDKKEVPPARPGNAAPWHRRYWQLPIVILLLLAILVLLSYGVYRLAPPAGRWIANSKPVAAVCNWFTDRFTPPAEEEPIRLRCEKYALTYNNDGSITTEPCQCLTNNCPPQVWIKNSRVELVREAKQGEAEPVVTQVIVRGDFYTSPPN